MADDRWLNAKNILAIRLDNLGDVLLNTPAMRAVKDTLPSTRLTLMASRLGAQVGELDPDIDDVMVYEAPWMDVWQERPHDSGLEQVMIQLIKKKRFDGAIIFTSYHQSSLPAAYMCYLADIPLRAAVSADGPGSLLTTRHKYPEKHLLHEVEKGLDLVASLGFHTSRPDLVLEVPEEAGQEMAKRLATLGIDLGRPFAMVHPGCTMPARTYPWEMYVEVADLLVEELGMQIVFSGVSGEVELVSRIQAGMRHQSRSLAGQTGIKELAALASLAAVVLTNNTGPMHIAAAMKRPVVALFALTNPPQQWGPWRTPHRQLYKLVPCAICYSRICPTDHACLRGVAPIEVVEAAAELLGKEQSSLKGAAA